MSRRTALSFTAAAAWLWAASLTLPACRGSSATAPDASTPAEAGVGAARAEVDPMAFFVVFQGEVEAILRREGNRCDGAFADLRRLVADRRTDFFKAVASHDSAGGTPALLPTGTTELLMRFAGQCPVQAAKLNDLVGQLVR